MALAFDPGAMLARSYHLPRGPRVCLRLGRISDRWGVAELLRRHDPALAQVDVARLLRADPREHLVVVATALVDRRNQVIGIGAIDLNPSTPERPWLVVTDEEMTDGLKELIEDALIGRVRALRRARSALRHVRAA
jgi:hypothetical protein